MAVDLLKKSYQLKDLKEINFKDLWDDYGVFTTMWIFGKPPKILFLENHINNLIKSLNKYDIKKKSIRRDIFEVMNKNLSKKNKYNHLLRIALNRKIISISLRKRFTPKLNFNLKLVNLERVQPEYKNLKYKKIISYLSKMDNTRSDIGLVSKNKILETGTSNLIFIKDDKIFVPKKNYYRGNTFKYFLDKIPKMYRKDVYIHDLKSYDEILLIGSGKGVTSVKTINQIGWKRKNLNKYRIFLKFYLQAVKKTKLYKF